MNLYKRTNILFIIVVIFITACGGIQKHADVTNIPVPSATSKPTSTILPSPTMTPSPTAIPYGGGVPLVAYIGGNGEGIELIIGDVFNNQIYYSVPLARPYLVSEGEKPQALWYGTIPISWSPDGHTILFVDQCGGGENVADLSICSYDLVSNQVTEVVSLPEEIFSIGHLSWSPDGMWITYEYETNKSLQTFVNLINVADGSYTMFPNTGAPRWDQQSQFLYFNQNRSWSDWARYDLAQKNTVVMNLRHESREYGKDKQNWGCRNYVPELDASLVHQENKDESNYLILIDSDKKEKLICKQCGDWYNYNLLFSPNMRYALLLYFGWYGGGTQVIDLLDIPITDTISNFFTGVAWSPDSNSYLVYRNDREYKDKPLFLIDRESGQIEYEYQFPTSSWGVTITDEEEFPSLDVHWPEKNKESNELYELVVERSQMKDAEEDHGPVSGFAQWVPQLQAWTFQCYAKSMDTTIDRVLIEDALTLKTTIICEYQDVNGDDQTIALAVGLCGVDRLDCSEHGPLLIITGDISFVNYMDYQGLLYEKQLPFDITVVFGMPNRTNAIYYGEIDLPYVGFFRTPHFDYIPEIHSSTSLQEFALSGNPELLDGLLLPITWIDVNQSSMCLKKYGCENHFP